MAAADGTSVSGEVDLAMVNAPGLADVRVGHMEASATVPQGGVLCQVDVSKEAQPDHVNPGDKFNYIIHVHNPHACTLTGVKVVDSITATRGVVFSILGEDPKADSVTRSSITWNDVGPLAPGATKDLVVHMAVSRGSGGGTFTEKASVTANCAIGNAQGSSTIAVPAAGSSTIQLPSISGGARIRSPWLQGPDGYQGLNTATQFGRPDHTVRPSGISGVNTVTANPCEAGLLAPKRPGTNPRHQLRVSRRPMR